MADVAIDKLKHEIQELSRQQREVNERLNIARRRGRGFARGRGGGRVGNRRKAETELEGPPKKKLSSVVKVNGGEDAHQSQRGGRNNRRYQGHESKEPVPRVIPVVDDPNLEKRNRRMFGALLMGTLEKFRQEEKQLSSSEALMRRSESMKMAERRAIEESDRLKSEEREHNVESKKRDLILRARLHIKAEEKQYELLFLQWSEHRKRLTSLLKTKTEPRILYLPAKCTELDKEELEENKKEFEEWKAKRKEELDEYVKQISEASMAKAEADVEKVENAKNRKRGESQAKEMVEEDAGRDEGDGDVQDVQEEQGEEQLERQQDQEAVVGDAMEDEDDYRAK